MAFLQCDFSLRGLWRYVRSQFAIQFGNPGDIPLARDYDGNGSVDLAIFRPSTGTWWWIQSSNGEARAAKWGTNGDTPVPADYDGDGKTDLAVWRPGAQQSTFWVLGSQNGVRVFPWGLSTDKVVSY